MHFITILQEFFKDLKDKTGAELENIVYFKDDSHYFVMTVKKSSLIKTGVLKQVCAKLLIDIWIYFLFLFQNSFDYVDTTT